MEKRKIVLSIALLFSGFIGASESGNPAAGQELTVAAVVVAQAESDAQGDAPAAPVNGTTIKQVLTALARNSSAPIDGEPAMGGQLLRGLWRGNGVPGTNPALPGRELSPEEIAAANYDQDEKERMKKGTRRVTAATSYLGLGAGTYRTGTLSKK